MNGPASYLDLLTIRLLEGYGEQFPISEWPTRLVLDQVWMPKQESPEVVLRDGSDGIEVAWFLTMLRTGGVFLVSPEDVSGAFAGGMAPMMELPPLPFPRIVIEGHALKGGPTAFMDAQPRDRLDYAEHVVGHGESKRFSEADEIINTIRSGTDFDTITPIHEWTGKEAEEQFPGEHLYMDMLILSEIEPGQVWDIGMGYHFGGPDTAVCPEDSFLFSTDRVTPQGIVPKPHAGDQNSERFRKVSEFVRTLTVTAAHLIVADRVPTREWPLPKGQRKDLRRKGIEAPRVYFVDLAASGDVKPGRSDREYTCRWLVSGHWRLNENGKTFVKHKGGICSWVRPYVKGPVGAPWKGRPVHGRSTPRSGADASAKRERGAGLKGNSGAAGSQTIESEEAA